MEAASFFVMLVPIYRTTWCHIPEDCNLNAHYCENLKSYQHMSLGGWKKIMMLSSNKTGKKNLHVGTLGHVSLFLIQRNV
jgi:hypothetical protein